ncbi:MAG: tRNA lysidine(34) synthetase TilS [Betaproteobacteria bacterium]|nr:tRNA lysidine(34) synthetase TilS [Betaproteobacteria bacterium]
MTRSIRIATAFAPHALAGRVAVALSGGLDSMVLLDLAAQTLRGHEGVTLEAIHVHHGLSTHADHWAQFCQRECAAREVPLTIRRVRIDRDNTGGQGVEAAARHARYQAFVECGARFVLAAQHLDDQAETVLHQLLRGTGWAGLAGMGEARALTRETTLIRPFLHFSRAELEDYAKAAGLSWIEDESNADTAYTRNFLRHAVMPLIAQRFPHYRASLSRAARHAAEADGLLEALAKIDLRWDGSQAFAAPLDLLPIERQTNALYHWLQWQGVPPPSHAQLSEWARQLFRPAPADKPHQAGGHGVMILRRNGVLNLDPRQTP